MRKRLFLHIGAHKTATTFLQSTFARSGDVLDDLGILYPQAGRIWQAHFKLCWDLKDASLKDRPLEALDHWATLIEEIDASPHEVVVVSSEEFGLGLDPTRLAVLSVRYDVAVIFYLRSPESYLESFYNQFVKDFDNRETRTLEGYVFEETLFFLDTMKLLRPWADIFGAAAVRLRLFGAAHMPDGILPDFLATLGCTRRPEFRPADLSILHKVSLPPDALDYLRLSNPWLTQSEGHHDFVVRLVQMAQERAADLQETRAGMLSLKARQNLRLRFRDSNMQAARLFLGADRTPFPPQDAPSPAGYDRRLPEATPRVIGKVAAMIRNIS